jgi:hypothetical protein
MVPVRLIIRRARKRVACLVQCYKDMQEKHEGADEEHTAPQVVKVEDENKTS